MEPSIPPPTIRAVVDEVIAGFDALLELAEGVEDEWQYVDDLAAAWRERLEAAAEANGDEPAKPESAAAIAALVAESSRIVDPHRAIDWLSTYPQVALLALTGTAPAVHGPGGAAWARDGASR